MNWAHALEHVTRRSCGCEVSFEVVSRAGEVSLPNVGAE